MNKQKLNGPYSDGNTKLKNIIWYVVKTTVDTT